MKKTVRDFEILLGNNSMKDPVLENFQQKAKDIEEAAGSLILPHEKKVVVQKPKQQLSDAIKEFN
jgi:hypothetical protein